VRALAKRIQSSYFPEASLHAIISSIRRFQVEPRFKKHEEEVENIFRESTISTRNKVSCITLKHNSLKCLEYVKSLEKKGVVKVVTGSKNAKIIISSSEEKNLLNKIPHKEIISCESSLGEVIITLNDKATHTKGVLAKIANELSLREINLRELIACLPEIIIYVEDKDAPRAHEILLSLS
jgi:hypothetical protein